MYSGERRPVMRGPKRRLGLPRNGSEDGGRRKRDKSTVGGEGVPGDRFDKEASQQRRRRETSQEDGKESINAGRKLNE